MIAEPDEPVRACSAPIAVVIPTCDRPALLMRALDSVFAQTVRPAEVVVVDVGGRSWSDAAACACEANSSITTRRLKAPAGTPAGAARNLGARATSSPVLAFLDDDDRWMPRYLAQAQRLMTEQQVECVMTPITIRKGDAAVRMPSVPAGLVSGDPVLTNGWSVTGSSLVVKQTAFAEIDGYDEHLFALNDVDLLVRLLDRGTRYGVATEPLVEQLIHSSGQLTRATNARLGALNAFIEKYAPRMSPAQRRYMRRERHRMLKHLAEGAIIRVWHGTADVVLTRPKDLRTRLRWRVTLRGGYD
jgi:glycosyltransferase involved in cell wall biosynthesis